jgi:hypothetical protein
VIAHSAAALLAFNLWAVNGSPISVSGQQHRVFLARITDLTTQSIPLTAFLVLAVMLGGDACCNRPLSNEQKESNRQKSGIRARIEHIFRCLSRSMKGVYLRYIGRRRNAAAIGLVNVIYNMGRYEQIVRLKLRPRTAA